MSKMSFSLRVTALISFYHYYYSMVQFSFDFFLNNLAEYFILIGENKCLSRKTFFSVE